MKVSRYIEQGSPTRCFLPTRNRRFEAECIRGDDDHYYCSKNCAKEAEDFDFSSVESLKRKA